MSEELVGTEKEAHILGWVPLEQFRGNESDWVDAETFVRRGKEINPILRKNNEILFKKLEAAQGEIQEVKKVAKEFEKFQKETAERKVKDLEKELEQLKNDKRDAISSGDGEKVVAIDDKIDEVKQQKADLKEVPLAKEEAPQNTTILDPVVKGWISRNEWFGVDTKLTRRVNAIAEDIREDSPHLSGEKFFEALDKELVEQIPEKFGKQGRNNPLDGSQRNSDSSSSKRGGKQSYANLPEDAKKACDRFVKSGLMKQEDYVSSYDWS